MPFKAYSKVNKYNNNILILEKGAIIDIYEEDDAVVYSCENKFDKHIKFINNCKDEYNNTVRRYTFVKLNNISNCILLLYGDYERIWDTKVLNVLGENNKSEQFSEYEIYDIEIMKCLSMLHIEDSSKNTIHFKLIDSDGNVIKDDYYMKDSFTYVKEKDKLKGSIYGTHTVRGNEIIVDCDEHSANIILKAIHMKAFKIKYVGNEDTEGLFKDDIVFDGSPDKQDSIEKEIIIKKYRKFDMEHTKIEFIGFVIIGIVLILMKLLF